MTAAAATVVGLFAGPGGWAEAGRQLGISELGLEHDATACETRKAAGHATIQADVATFDPRDLRDLVARVWGLIASPPCTTFSAAGSRFGNRVPEILTALIRDVFAGRDTREQRCREIARALHKVIPVLPARRGRAQRIVATARSAALVAEPARYILELNPEWVALEQVPSVLPLFEVYATELRQRGYSVWCGVLNSADYGVPQTRLRAILIASRTRIVSRPEPTHYDPRKGDQLWGQQWITMAEALGWGATGRPCVTVTSGGTSTGGAEPLGHRGRDALAAEQTAGRWAGRKPEWAVNRPATTVQGDPRLGRPGHKNRDPGTCETQFGQDSARISVADATALQSFRPGYPWQGSETRQFEQVGNAVPPGLGVPVLAMATGRTRAHAITSAAAVEPLADGGEAAAA